MTTSPHDTPRAAWTDERVAELRRLWAEGMEARQIAEALGGGATKNSVLGKAHRLRLAGRDEHADKPPKPVPACPSATPRFKAHVSPPPPPLGMHRMRRRGFEELSPSGKWHRKRREDQKAQAMAAVEQSGGTVPLIELTESMCRYPSGDGADIRFCGAPKARGSWCAHHAGIVYVPLHRRPEGVDYRVKRGDGQTAIRWRHGRGVTRYAAE